MFSVLKPKTATDTPCIFETKFILPFLSQFVNKWEEKEREVKVLENLVEMAVGL